MEKGLVLRPAVRWAWGIALMLCTACIGPTPYQRVGTLLRNGDNEYVDNSGYNEVVLDSHTYLVSFAANQETDSDTVVRYLQYRCAELTVALGYDHFLVLPSSAVAGATGWRHAEKTIRLYKGEAPEGSFDAREVIQVIGPLIRRPDDPAPKRAPSNW